VFGAVKLVKKRKTEQANLPVSKAITLSVNVVKPKIRSIEETREFLGKYYSVNHPVISSKLSGYITQLFVEEGDKVSEGELLIKIDDSDLIASIESQKAAIKAVEQSIESLKVNLNALYSDYKYAKNVYDRNKELFKVDAISQENLDLSKVAMEMKLSKYNSTKKSIDAKKEELKSLSYQLKSKETLLKYTTIKSPINGIIGKLFLKQGDLAAPGKPILTIYSDKKRVEFNFPTNLINEIKKGQTVKILSNKAKISKILPNSNNSLATAYVDLDEKLNLPENSNVKLYAVLKASNGISVPLNSILSKDDLNFVFIYEDDKFKPIKVDIIAKDNKFAVISDNITLPVATGSNDKLSSLFLIKDAKAVTNEK
jgi:RND family efflux transporter MFP subunit